MTAKIKIVLATILFSISISAQTEKNILGKWKGEDKQGMGSEFYLEKDGLYYGKIINDEENKGALGKTIFKKLKYDPKSKSFKGTMSPPDRDMEINATITFEGNEKLKVVAKKFMMTKIVYLIKIK
jgi:uncharacterized protein (DUF2147 family)